MSPAPPLFTVPRVILGCGTFGGIGGASRLIGHGLNRVSAYETLDEATALGIDLFDTAERYAEGESEATMGAWLASIPSRVAESVRIATKVAPASFAGDEAIRFDKRYVAQKLERSLERLGRERVTLYLSHAPCPVTPIEETVEAFAAVIESGRAEHIGCCNVGPVELLAALDAARRRGVPAFEWVQNGFSLLTPTADREVRAICRERGLRYSPYSPLAGGVLTGKYRRGEPIPPGTRMALRPDGRELTDATHDALDVLRAIADARRASCAATALAWILADPDCSAPVVGPARSKPHLGHVADAMALKLSESEREQLTRAFSILPPA